MAHIVLTQSPKGSPAVRLVINGIDFSDEVYRDIRLVEVGDDPMLSEVGLQVTFALSRLDLGGDSDVVVTDHFLEEARRVRSMVGLNADA